MSDTRVSRKKKVADRIEKCRDTGEYDFAKSSLKKREKEKEGKEGRKIYELRLVKSRIVFYKY